MFLSRPCPGSISYLVLPSIVGLDVVGNPTFDLLRQVEILARKRKLSIDFFNANAVVHESEEPGRLGRRD